MYWTPPEANAAALPLQRHGLVWPDEAGWRELLAQTDPADGPARDCLAAWAGGDWPLVVTRQPETLALPAPMGDPDHGPGPAPAVALGLPAPLRWQRRRLALRLPLARLRARSHFPDAEAAADLLPPAAVPAWRRLCAALRAQGARARVHGSHGWQLLTGQAYLHAGSDIDLCIAVADAGHADAAAALLHAHAPALPCRLDGELILPDGRAYAWREWRAWRAGATRAILCKTLHAARLEWAATAPAGAAKHHAAPALG